MVESAADREAKSDAVRAMVRVDGLMLRCEERKWYQGSYNRCIRLQVNAIDELGTFQIRLKMGVILRKGAERAAVDPKPTHPQMHVPALGRYSNFLRVGAGKTPVDFKAGPPSSASSPVLGRRSLRT